MSFPSSQAPIASPPQETATARMQSHFPIVARIRKGGPKEKVTKGDRQIEVMGKDLNDRFRVEFAPGTGAVQAAFRAAYGTFQPATIKALIPDTSVWNGCFSWYNGAFLTRLLAKADDTHYLTMLDPETGKYVIHDGQPFRPFIPKEEIEFTTASGKTVMLKIRSTLFLRVFLYQLTGHFVSFELYSTSYYDRLNLTAQLAAIQGLANILRSGNVGSVPLVIYRAEREVNWTKGSNGTRVKKWLIHITPESKWAEKVAFPALRELLGVSTAERMLTIPKPNLVGEIDPHDENHEEGQGEGPGKPGTPANQPTMLSPERTAELTPRSPNDWTHYWNVAVPCLGASRSQALDAVEASQGAIQAFQKMVEIMAGSQK